MRPFIGVTVNGTKAGLPLVTFRERRARWLGIHDSTGPTTRSLAVVAHFLAIDWVLHARVGSPDELAYQREARDWRQAGAGAAS